MWLSHLGGVVRVSRVKARAAAGHPGVLGRPPPTGNKISWGQQCQGCAGERGGWRNDRVFWSQGERGR
jgi:hypothetical protein